jgi:ABC-type phosphate transport system permease subunit
MQATEPAATVDERRPSWHVVALQVVLVLVLCAALGAVAGLVWEKLWTPPTGLVYHHHWFADENGVRGMFSGTGWYVVVAVLAGTLAGVASALLLARSELATLAAVVVGSLVGAWVMWQVGTALEPRRCPTTATSWAR